ncbi:MAG: aldo/keto reductase [Caldilineaceae bacterium]
MEMGSFGQTGLTVSRVGIGLAALGRPGYINLGHAADLGGTYGVDAMQAQTDRVLDAAWAAGVRYFDAARSYGRAEEFLGNWLRARDIDPGAVTIGSKWGYTYTADWQVDADVHEVKEHSLPVFRRQWQETQDRLGRYVDLYQIHSATFASGVLTNTAVLDALARLKADGVRIGLSLSGPDQGGPGRRAGRDGGRCAPLRQRAGHVEPAGTVGGTGVGRGGGRGFGRHRQGGAGQRTSDPAQ